MAKVEGRIRESADGLRPRRDTELEEKRLREAQQEVAEAAAARRETEQNQDREH